MRLREGNKEQDIIKAAINIFAKKGFHETKISEIADEANIATGSVYLYFKNKEAIILKLFEQLWEKLYYELKNYIKLEEISPLEKIEGIIDLIFDVFAENPSLAMVFVNEQYRLMQKNKDGFTIYYERFLDLGMLALDDGKKHDAISTNIDTNIFRYYIFGAIRNLLHHWAQEPEKFPLYKIRQNVKHLTKKGISKK